MNNMIWFRITLGRIPDILCMVYTMIARSVIGEVVLTFSFNKLN